MMVIKQYTIIKDARGPHDSPEETVNHPPHFLKVKIHQNLCPFRGHGKIKIIIFFKSLP